jgi:hypothetical protein
MLPGLTPEGSTAVVVIEKMCSDWVSTTVDTGSNPQIRIAVIVIIHPIAWPRVLAVGDDDSHFGGRHFGEGAVAIVSIQDVILAAPIRYKQVDETVPVIIRPRRIQGIAAVTHQRTCTVSRDTSCAEVFEVSASFNQELATVRSRDSLFV